LGTEYDDNDEGTLLVVMSSVCPIVFIAEGGPECLKTNQEAIQDCVNKTLSRNLPTEPLSINNLPSLVIEEKQCR
jgi:hypothetical protein